MNNFENEFLDAIDADDSVKAVEVVKKGFPVNKQIKLKSQGIVSNGYTYPLILSVEKGTQQLTGILIAYGAKVNCVDSYTKTPLLAAAASGRIEVFKLLIRHKANIYSKDYFGNSILHVSASNKHLELVKYIIKKLNFSVSTRNRYLETPLQLCKKLQENSMKLQELEDIQKVMDYLLKHSHPKASDLSYTRRSSGLSPLTKSFFDPKSISNYLNRKHIRFRKEAFPQKRAVVSSLRNKFQLPSVLRS